MTGSLVRPGLVVGAALTLFSPPAPDGLTRAGNAALDRGEALAALDWYGKAEARTTDPGLVAFNKAVTLSRLGRHREAELHFRRCSEDAVGGRRARLLFGLGNALLRRSEGRYAVLVEEAARAYEACLAVEGVDPELAADARHNLDLARKLREHARATGEPGLPPDEGPHPKGEAPGKAPESLDKGKGERQPAPTPGSAERAEGAGDFKGQPAATAAPPPGKGNLPPLVDDDVPAGLTAEDAAAHLQQAIERIRREQRDFRRRLLASPSPSLMDW
jgi:hypothetical protein